MDLSHHLSAEAKARSQNPMKEFLKIAGSRKGLVTLANGTPTPSLFTLDRMDFHVPSLDVPCPVQTWQCSDPNTKKQVISIAAKDDSSPLPLEVAMQYSLGAGTLELRQILTTLNTHLHPSVPHNIVTLHCGNADGINKLFRLLGSPGDTFLTEEFAYAALTYSPKAQEINWAPIKVDADGLVPENMENILESWNESKQGERPHVLYIVPCGQNPTGSTLPLERRKKIYEIAQKYDIIILEDDPYFMLQFMDTNEVSDENANDTATNYTRRFIPSFLSMDVDGRVIRVDSFSKILAPGFRLGWFTSTAFFHERLEILTDASVQQPHGMGQLYISELLSPKPRGWGIDGYLHWGKIVAQEYKRKKDLLLNLLKDGFGDDWVKLVSAADTMSGMFVSLQIAVKKHPDFQTLDEPTVSGVITNTKEIMDRLLLHLLDHNVLVIPAITFVTNEKWDYTGNGEKHILDRVNFFRLTFAGTDDAIREGTDSLVKGVRSFFSKEY